MHGIKQWLKNRKTDRYDMLYVILWVVVSLPGLLRKDVTFVGILLFLQGMTLWSAAKMFGRLFTEKRTVWFGVLFYMTCPWRIYLCYDRADLGSVCAWALFPVVVWSITGLYRQGARWQEILLGTLAVAGIWYADFKMGLMTVGVLLFSALWYRKLWGILVTAVGTVCFLPQGMSLLRFVGMGDTQVWNPMLGSIAPNGYAVGQFFTSFAYAEGHPGLGLGLFASLLLLLWLLWTEESVKLPKGGGFFGAAACLLAWMSMSCFPWDYVQRLGMPFVRLVALLESPAFFFGGACGLLCIPAAYAMEGLFMQDKEYVRKWFPAIIAAASLGLVLCGYTVEF